MGPIEASKRCHHIARLGTEGFRHDLASFVDRCRAIGVAADVDYAVTIFCHLLLRNRAGLCTTKAIEADVAPLN
jgi:hypothetical protein